MGGIMPLKVYTINNVFGLNRLIKITRIRIWIR